MKTNSTGYRGYRFPPEIISHGVWLCYQFRLSFREVEPTSLLVSSLFTSAWTKLLGGVPDRVS